MAEEEKQSLLEDDKKSAFGESSHFTDPRLDYTHWVWRDWGCLIYYYLCVFAVIGYCFYLWSVDLSWTAAIDEEVDSDLGSFLSSVTDYTGFYLIVFLTPVLGILLGFCWMQFLRVFARIIILIMLVLNVVLWIAIAVLGFVFELYWLGAIGLIVTLFFTLYVWFVWPRVQLTSVLLEIGSKIVTMFSGVVLVQLTTVCLDIVWWYVIIYCIWGYLLVAVTEDGGDVNVGIVFALLLSLYWSNEVNANIAHTTCCGVSAVWYFTPDGEMGWSHTPTLKAFGRAMTTSFGSIVMGSLLVSLVHLVRAMISCGCQNCCARCLCSCCLRCLEAMIRYFNRYAYAHCAIYGVGFFEGAKQTFDLLQTSGVMAIINDDLSGKAMFMGNLIAFVLCGGISFAIAYSYYWDLSSVEDDVISVLFCVGLTLYGAIFGAILCSIVLSVVHSAVITLFVCFAEEPAIMEENHADDFNAIKEVRPDFGMVPGDAPEFVEPAADEVAGAGDSVNENVAV